MNVIVTIHDCSLNLDVDAPSQHAAEQVAVDMIDKINTVLREAMPENQPAILLTGGPIETEVRL